MTVFANGLEVSSKAQNNKIIAAFPDTCMTPPENPATPPGIPVPYPAFGLDTETKNGTGTVKIGGKTVSQKNLSYYSKTTGTEAGCAAKKGVVTSTNTGKAYAASWSNNVKAEGEPVARMSDRATVNHASPGPNDGNGNILGETSDGGDVDCGKLADQIEFLLTKNKKPTDKKGKRKKKRGGHHGYLFRLIEQKCGEQPPETDGWEKHQAVLKEEYKRIKADIDLFMQNCDLDDYEFSKGGGRKGAQRDKNVKDAINGINEGSSEYMPDQVTHIGDDHALCANLDEVRADETLEQVADILSTVL